MHHLIDRKGYGRTRNRIHHFLSSLHNHLKPGGILLVREIYHEFRGFATLGSRAIFTATTLPVPQLIERAMQIAGLQTANVGICFQTRTQWQKLFEQSGFSVLAQEDRVWPGQPYRKFGFSQSGDLHYLLSRSRPEVVSKGANHA